MPKPSIDRERILPEPLRQMARSGELPQDPSASPASRRGMFHAPDGQMLPRPQTVWRPRWKWVGKLLGREVPVPVPPAAWIAPGDAPGASQTGASQTATASAASISDTPDPVTAAQAAAAPVPAMPARSTEKAAEPAAASDGPQGESWGSWAYPLLAVLSGLILVFALGTVFGTVLALGWIPPAVSRGFFSALAQAPAGLLFLLLGGFGCLVQAHDDARFRWVWRLSAAILILLFAWVLVGGWF